MARPAATAMAMDFFGHQEVARRNTRLLLFYYLLAVALIVLAVYVVVSLVLGEGQSLWDPGLLAGVAALTLGLIGLGTLYKVLQLSRGGAAVAELLGGRLVDPSTGDLDERRLLNVVEEMSIASGLPVPPVYVLDREPGINAFAAGNSPADAVVAVTRGTLDLLSRDELQGVVAHEFSHILNGDMRLNLRLMGVLFGILVLAMVGYWLMRSSWYAGTGRRRRRGEGNLGMALLALGLGLMVIGYVGVFFARLIKAAVSRQREFLADAAAVEFTRNPDGLSGALRKIGGYRPGSRVEDRHAEEASHLFFASGVSGFLSGLFSTHPPLQQRIRRIDPSWDGSLPEVEAPPARQPQPGPGLDLAGLQAQFAASPQAVVGAAGTARLDYAVAVLRSVPEPVLQAAREPYGARAVVYGLLLDERPEVRDRQLERLAGEADPAVYRETLRLAPGLAQAGRRSRLPLSELCLPVLRQLSPAQYRSFRENVRALVQADERLSVSEFALQRKLLHYLEPAYGQAVAAERQDSLETLRPAVVTLLATLAEAGHADAGQSWRAFERAMAELYPGYPLWEAEPARPSLEALDGALVELAGATPRRKRQILAACVACVAADGTLTVEEGELLRTVSEALGVPLPPLLGGG